MSKRTIRAADPQSQSVEKSKEEVNDEDLKKRSPISNRKNFEVLEGGKSEKSGSHQIDEDLVQSSGD